MFRKGKNDLSYVSSSLLLMLSNEVPATPQRWKEENTHKVMKKVYNFNDAFSASDASFPFPVELSYPNN